MTETNKLKPNFYKQCFLCMRYFQADELKTHEENCMEDNRNKDKDFDPTYGVDDNSFAHDFGE